MKPHRPTVIESMLVKSGVLVSRVIKSRALNSKAVTVVRVVMSSSVNTQFLESGKMPLLKKEVMLL